MLLVNVAPLGEIPGLVVTGLVTLVVMVPAFFDSGFVVCAAKETLACETGAIMERSGFCCFCIVSVELITFGARAVEGSVLVFC